VREQSFDALINAALHVVEGFRAASGGEPLRAESHQRLAKAVEGTTAFRELSQEALTTATRYAPKGEEKLAILAELRAGECRDELAAFLRRVGFYQLLWNHRRPKPAALREYFLRETTPDTCEFLRLIPIDGLGIRDRATVPFPGGRLRYLDVAEWNGFFESELHDAPNVNELSNLPVLELRAVEALDPNPLRAAEEPAFRTVTKLAGHWLAFLNLWDLESIRPVALYEKPDTRLAMRPVKEHRITSPSWVGRIDDETGEEHEEPFLPVEIGDPAALSTLLGQLETGRLAAAGAGPRVATALHWFQRVADELFGWEEGWWHDQTIDEDIVSDSFTVLEALLLGPNERLKGPKISKRAAALISAADADIPGLEASILQTYGLRNRLVHGDARPDAGELETAVRNLQRWVRQVLVGMLRLNGDQARVILGVTDGTVRAANREMVPRYPGR
jgi:hypothetical protein